jgi:hypothetical protein
MRQSARACIAECVASVRAALAVVSPEAGELQEEAAACA